jgi:hypothetical protein
VDSEHNGTSPMHSITSSFLNCKNAHTDLTQMIHIAQCRAILSGKNCSPVGLFTLTSWTACSWVLPLMGRVHMCLEMRILWTSPQIMKRKIQRTIMACRPRRAPKQEDTRQLAKPTQYCYEPRQEDEEPGSPSHGVSNAAAQRDTNPKECSHESGKGLWCH